MPRQKFFIFAIAVFWAAAAGSFAVAGSQLEKTNMASPPSSSVPILREEKLSAKQTITLVINRASTSKKIIALTFDADMTRGMERELKTGKVKSWYNGDAIKALKETQTPATLFLTGLWIKNYPEITEDLGKNPLFEIASHSYSHPAFALPCYNLPAISNERDEEEIVQTENLLKRYAPSYKKYFRFPGFCHDDFDIAAVENHGYKIIGGDIIAGDGFTQNTGGIVSRAVSRAKPGSIVVLHMQGGPDAPKTAEALPEIIRQLREKGYQFVKVSELLDAK